ncbi:hypothetical protein BCR42DRAFT_487562 [Absidia repens]|uniref:MARVEL domain-containing protein n=1 Tax=Absidia repens TaxID=90262 RepID=A0A1X2IX61_9FUNG|nr:hypothetical protein BCR42DRAFT_487562 [Absidia repens]
MKKDNNKCPRSSNSADQTKKATPSSPTSSESKSYFKDDQDADENGISPSSFHPPNIGRLVIRFWQFIAAIGALGFQIGASHYSGIAFVFRDPTLQYYTYAIDFMSLMWVLFLIYVYLTRRFGGNTGKVKRPVAFVTDTALSVMFGVSSFYQFATYNCPPGRYNGWCDFHNTGRFFLLSLFLSYAIMMCWDLFGGCNCLRA